MRVPAFILVSLFMLLCAAGPVALAQGALAIQSVRFGAHPDRTRMVIELNGATDWRVFALPEPWRLVVDLPDFQWNAGSIDRPQGTGVTNIRQGNLQPGVSRIVIDLEKPISIKSAFALPRTGGKPDRLVIDYVPSSPVRFATEKDRVFGRLNPGDAGHVISSAAATPAPALQAKPIRAAAPGGMIVPEVKPDRDSAVVRPVIVIDPGHGGVDPGAPGANGTFEKDITLAMARELKKRLDATGRYRAVLTRDRDIYLKLYERVAFARSQNADLFISIHADSIGKPNVSGASIYTLSEKASDAQTAKLAAQENRVDLIAGMDLSHEGADVANILIDLAMRETTNQSKFLANTVVGRFDQNGLRTLDSPHRHAGFAVLKAPDIPSVLIEIGFMSNRREAELLSQPSYREKLAATLVSGIDGYFQKVRKNQGS